MSTLTVMSSNDASSILGWVSIACWIVVYSPQIYENYTLQSGEGLSLAFVLVWLLGDICNAAGAIAAGLLPTVIILAIYYSLCDITLLIQIYYYRWKRAAKSVTDETDETAPLLSGDNTTKDGTTPHTPTRVLLLRYTLAFAFVAGTGVAAWWLNNEGTDGDVPQEVPDEPISWRIQVVGWTSALAYLGARIPQIYKNRQTRCEGLSPAMFVFAICGNVTYVLSICVVSMSKSYIWTNGSWLAGSGLKVFLDLLVLGQVFYYRSVGPAHEADQEVNGH